jgi:amino acid transporter
VIATLAITLLLYVLVALIGVLAVPLDVLAYNEAPLVAISASRAPWAGKALSVIGMFAVLNGILIQIIMASRIVHGMARERWIPAFLGQVNVRTRTPILATVVAVVLIAVLALALPLGILAQATSFLVLAVAVLVNGALLRLKMRERDRDARKSGTLSLPMAVPAIGTGVSLVWAALILIGLF